MNSEILITFLISYLKKFSDIKEIRNLIFNSLVWDETIA